MTASSEFTDMFSMMAASAFLPFLPDVADSSGLIQNTFMIFRRLPFLLTVWMLIISVSLVNGMLLILAVL